MLRYLRGKGFSDLLHDLIVWLVPGPIGRLLALSMVLSWLITFYYLVYGQQVVHWVWGKA